MPINSSNTQTPGATQKNSGAVETFGLDDDANVEEFMSRFSDPHTYVPPAEVNQRFDQFNQSNHPEFNQAIASYLSQMDPDAVGQAARNLNPEQRAGFASRLLDMLKGAGIDLGQIARSVGLSSTDPVQMDTDDLRRLAGYAQQNAPGAFQETVREQPFFLKALGNPLVQGALAILAARYLSKRSR